MRLASGCLALLLSVAWPASGGQVQQIASTVVRYIAWDYGYMCGEGSTPAAAGVACAVKLTQRDAYGSSFVFAKSVGPIYPSTDVAYLYDWYRADGVRVDYYGTSGRVDTACPEGYVFGASYWTCQLNQGAVVTSKTAGPCPPGTCPVSNPIHPGTGNKFQIETDYVGSGPMPLRLARTYNRIVSAGKAFSSKWMSNLEPSVKLGINGPVSTVAVTRPDGKTFFFTLIAGVWTPDSDVTDRLVRLTDASGNPTGWRYTSGDNDEVENYDNSGRLVSVTNRAALTQTRSYDASGRLVRVTDSFGRALTFTYDSTGRIATMTDPAGGVHTYAYGVNNNLASVNYPDGKLRTYHYENVSFPDALTGITDENGNRYATWTYDTQGRAISSQHAGGADATILTYNADGTTTVTNALGAIQTYNFQTLLGVVKNSAISGAACPSCGSAGTTYDANGFIASHTDWNGNVTKYTHDTQGLEISRTEAFGTAQARIISTVWHANFRFPTQVVEKNASGTVLRTTDFAYDAAGNLVAKTVTDTASGRTRSSNYTYNATGQMLTADGPRADVADVTTYTYYASDDLDVGKRGNLATMTNALGHTTQIAAYDPHGRPLTIVDPNGLTTQLAYDPRGRLLSRSVGGETTSYAYDGVGQLTQVTLPDGSSLTYTYDAAHRLTGITDSLGNRISYTLDAAGNRTKEEVFDPTGALAQTRSRVYDSLNRLAQEIWAQNQVTQYGYDNQGNVTSVTDPLGRVTANAYDALNRLLRVTDPGLGQTKYGYNALDQLVSVTDPRNLVTGYAYDGLNNLNEQVSPDTGIAANAYDAAGNLLTQTDAKGQTTSYSYDALNRVTRIAYADAQVTTFAYDQGTNGVGRLTGVTDPTGATSYSYDPKGRLLTETRTMGSVAYTTAYGYDAAGRLTQLTYPSGRQVAYTLDGLGRIAAISTTANGRTDPVVTAVAYRPFGGVASVTYGNGQTYTRQYDQDGRINAYTLATQTQAIGYDAASRIGFISDAANPAETWNYGYDALDRLVSAVGPTGNQGFGYDAVGNRATKTVGAATDTYAYSATSNRLAAITNAAGATRNYIHDPNGSITNDGGNEYAYDARGRMTRAASVVGITNYQVNALGQRVRKQGAATDAVFHYDKDGRLIAETDSRGGVRAEYLYLNEMPVAVIR